MTTTTVHVATIAALKSFAHVYPTPLTFRDGVPAPVMRLKAEGYIDYAPTKSANWVSFRLTAKGVTALRQAGVSLAANPTPRTETAKKRRRGRPATEIIDNQKLCKMCEVWQPLENFPKTPRGYRSSPCMSCRAESVTARARMKRAQALYEDALYLTPDESTQAVIARLERELELCYTLVPKLRTLVANAIQLQEEGD